MVRRGAGSSDELTPIEDDEGGGAVKGWGAGGNREGVTSHWKAATIAVFKAQNLTEGQNLGHVILDALCQRIHLQNLKRARFRRDAELDSGDWADAFRGWRFC